MSYYLLLAMLSVLVLFSTLGPLPIPPYVHAPLFRVESISLALVLPITQGGTSGGSVYQVDLGPPRLLSPFLIPVSSPPSPSVSTGYLPTSQRYFLWRGRCRCLYAA